MATKVFVGNLSFKIGSEKLRDEFSVAGNVLSANIITRGPRSLGYGFVEFASRDDAEKAVSAMNKKNIDGREINVEVANPRTEPVPSEKPEGEKPERRARRPRNRSQRGQGQQQGGQQLQSGGRPPRSQGQQQGQQGQQQGGQPRRQYKPRQPQGQGQQPVQQQVQTSEDDEGGRPFGQRRFRNRRGGRRNQGQGQQGQQQGGQQGQQQGQQQPQFQRKKPAPQPKKQQERVSSSTTLFVANLPFSVDDKELAEIFSKNLKVVSAHVVKKRNQRSKGFGFVEFESEADQQAALKDFDGSTVHERVLNVKVALTAVPGEEEEGAEKPAASGDAAAPQSAEGEKEGDAAKAEPAQEGGKAEAAAPAAAEGGEKKSGQ